MLRRVLRSSVAATRDILETQREWSRRGRLHLRLKIGDIFSYFFICFLLSTIITVCLVLVLDSSLLIGYKL